MLINGIKGDEWLGVSVMAYLEANHIPKDRVVVEVDGVIVPSVLHNVTFLKLDQRVEIIQFVGGG